MMKPARTGVFLLFAATFAWAPARGQSISTLEDLARLDPQQLNALYISANPGVIPNGVVRGLPLFSPGSRFAVPLSRSGRLIWQGKIFKPEQGAAVNRFGGLRVVRGKVGYGASLLDGRCSIILDYSETSLVYRRYRDEIREVAPGIYLGLMYDRNKSSPKPVRYFAFQIP